MTYDEYVVKYGQVLVDRWLSAAEVKYLKLKEKSVKPKKVNVNKMLAQFGEAEFAELKRRVSQ